MFSDPKMPAKLIISTPNVQFLEISFLIGKVNTYLQVPLDVVQPVRVPNINENGNVWNFDMLGKLFGKLDAFHHGSTE